MKSNLDKEWVNLMLVARELGVTKEQVSEFIRREKVKASLANVKP